MLSMCIPCNSAGHCTSTKGIDKKKPSIALCDIVCLIDMRYVYNIYEKIQIVSISEKE